MFLAALILLLLIAIALQTETGQEGISGIVRWIGAGLPDEELNEIQRIATLYNIDPRFLAALRRAEMGGPGNEFGIESIPTPRNTYEEQAAIAAKTISNTLARFRRNMLTEPVGSDGRYTQDFIAYFSRGGPGYPGYAPIGASDDPRGFNQNHFGNLVALYSEIETVTV